MNRTYSKVLSGLVGGLAGGLVVSAILQAAVALGVDPASDLVQMQRRALLKSGRPSRAPKASTTLPEEAVGHGWHLALSGALGAIYAASRQQLDRKPAANGAIWGLLFYPLAFWLLGPLTGLTERPWRERKDLLFRRPLVHLAFGATTGSVAALVDRAISEEATRPQPTAAN